MEKYKIYVLRWNYYNNIDIFTNKDERHYVQYRKKWDSKLSVKHWTLNELVWEYEYWDDIMKVELFEREIELPLSKEVLYN